jgi:hypothetical protein
MRGVLRGAPCGRHHGAFVVAGLSCRTAARGGRSAPWPLPLSPSREREYRFTVLHLPISPQLTPGVEASVVQMESVLSSALSRVGIINRGGVLLCEATLHWGSKKTWGGLFLHHYLPFFLFVLFLCGTGV